MNFKLISLRVLQFILISFVLSQNISYAQLSGTQSSATDNTNITKSKITKVKLQLQWKYQFQFAGFIVAKELGYYNEVGLDVSIIEYNNSSIVQDLENHVIDFAIMNSLLNYESKQLNKISLFSTFPFSYYYPT